MPPKDNKKNPKAERDLLDEEQQLSDEIVKMGLRLSALKAHHFARLDEVTALTKDRDELRLTCSNYEEDLSTATTGKVDILTDFARQYKREENTKIQACIELDTALNRIEEEKLKLADELKKVEADYDEAISAVKTEHDSLSTRIGEMEREFGVIMNDTQFRGSHGQSAPVEFS
ncbi:hypothetical protein DQ04_02741100 [Trypanosoma grayi]|uniref:hypothetical protein n=1 Tax=Trypanosoma grayi TaxID=71804 RepID=UPI0004F4A2FF|nr:hypothetical protein DQ04_02741100 [Trypanosoma grayi]KEG11325.1 hypothetical protein DQ04_02741100 [Trypanosoma grayi]